MNLSHKPAFGFCCEPMRGGGLTYSLTTLLGHFLQKAEQQYGKRDKKWTILGIEFCGDIPCYSIRRQQHRARIAARLRAAQEGNSRRAAPIPSHGGEKR
jgi:hypothetical protein